MVIDSLLARHDDGGTSWLYLPFLASCLGLTPSDEDAVELDSLITLISSDRKAAFRGIAVLDDGSETRSAAIGSSYQLSPEASVSHHM
jgi:hypothetical protein